MSNPFNPPYGDEEDIDLFEEEDYDLEESSEDFSEEEEFWSENQRVQGTSDHVWDAPTPTSPKGILKNSTPVMAGGLDAPQNPSTTPSNLSRRTTVFPTDPDAGEKVLRKLKKPAPGFQSAPSPSLPRYNPSLLSPSNDATFMPDLPPYRGPGPWLQPVFATENPGALQPSSESEWQPKQQTRAIKVAPSRPEPLSEVPEAIKLPDRPPGTLPIGDFPTNDKTRGPPADDPESQPPAPPGDTIGPTTSEGPGWDFTSLQLVLESPIVPRSIPPSSIPSPLGYYKHEQVDFYLIKKFGNEVYNSWVQANGDWHGIPAQPNTELSDARPAVRGIKDVLKGKKVEEPELNFSIWAPKAVGVDVHFQSEEEKDDSLADWEMADDSQLRPELGPTNLFQHTFRVKNNYSSSKKAPRMPIWNGKKGGVYKFPSAAPMSTEKRINETPNAYFDRYNDDVGRLLMYPNQKNAYEGASKDLGAYRIDNKVVRREFALDIRRINKKSIPPYLPSDLPTESFDLGPVEKETIIINDIARKTEGAYLEDARDGSGGGTGFPNAEIKVLPTINLAKLKGDPVDRPPDPWLVPEEKELELRAQRVNKYNPKARGALKRPNLHDEFDNEAAKDLIGTSAYFVVNTDPRPLKINGLIFLAQGQIAGPLPAFAWFETPGGQVAFWWGRSGTFYKPALHIGQKIGKIIDKYAPENYPDSSAQRQPRGPVRPLPARVQPEQPKKPEAPRKFEVPKRPEEPRKAKEPTDLEDAEARRKKIADAAYRRMAESKGREAAASGTKSNVKFIIS